MATHSPGGAVRILSALAFIAHVFLLAGGTMVLVATPAIKLLAPGSAESKFGLPVQAEMRDADAAVETRWGGARLEVKDVRGSLRLPISAMPWRLFGVLWAYTAVAIALMLLFLHHLRTILRRTRDGVAFDPDNARRLWLLGLLALGLALLQAVTEFLTSLTVQRGLTSGSIGVPARIHVDGTLVLFALVLLSLAEIFRRGAELEHEQSLVV